MSEDTNQGGGTADDAKGSGEIDALKAQVAELEKKNGELRTESAKYRTARNDALKQAHALGAVVKAHNIAFDLEKADTSGLKVENGKIEGEFAYTPAEKPAPDTTKPADQGTGISMADVKNMTPEQINENWEQVQAAMKKGYD